MAITNLIKISGVVQVIVGSAQPVYYGPTPSVRWQIRDDQNGVIIVIEQPSGILNDVYNVLTSELLFNGSPMTTISQLKTTLNGFFGL